MTLYISRIFHQPNFKISGDDKELFALLRLLYSPFIDENPIDGTYDIEITKCGNDYTIKHNGAETVTNMPLVEIDRIFFESTVYDNSILALHGAAVEAQGKAYLFLAATTTGKTTLTSYLTSAGFGYITDDCILIDREKLTVFPFNCPVKLREGGLEVLTRIGKTPRNLRHIDDAFVQRYLYTPQNCVVQPLPLGSIYFIERSETENMLVSLSTNEKMSELLKSPITLYQTSPQYLKLLARLVKFGCNRLVYRDMNFVADIINEAAHKIIGQAGEVIG